MDIKSESKLDNINLDDLSNNLPKSIMKKLLDKANYSLTGLFESKSFVLNLVIFYIIYILTKDIIKGVISVIFYTAAIVFTAYYVNSYLKEKEKENKL